ncbi:pleckstrin (PH) domain superfamily protein [Artemisia annua]|uniref:Pleckstrin (PH) domain superfamily protein n=1 Tax=Artemisia annua TaxID=35608 RepID=A0A2U1KWR7_ARTAN|nr:pleckstrin (PH) domain superfamily protein [Artemisia annua]
MPKGRDTTHEKQSATSYDSLVGVFRYKPFDAKVDWSMVAKAFLCYLTGLFGIAYQKPLGFGNSGFLTKLHIGAIWDCLFE